MTQGLSVSPLELHKRTNTDCAWAIGYLTTAAVAIVAGIYGASANNLYGTNGLLNPPTTCTNRRQLTTNLAPYISIAYEVGPPTLAFSGFFALLIGSIWMAALQCAAKPVVIGTLVLKGIVLIGLALGALVIGLPMITSSIFLIIALLYFAFLYCARRKIALTSALLEQSVRVSSAHPGMLPKIKLGPLAFSDRWILTIPTSIHGSFEQASIRSRSCCLYSPPLSTSRRSSLPAFCTPTVSSPSIHSETRRTTRTPRASGSPP